MELKASPLTFSLESARWAKEATGTSRKNVHVIIVAERAIWHQNANSETLTAISVRKGHLEAVCRSKTKKPSGDKKQPPSPRKICQIGDEYQEEEEENSLYTIKAVSASHPLMVEVEIDGQCVQMELDTGAAYSIMSEATYQGTVARW